jgi:hypothetical protein
MKIVFQRVTGIFQDLGQLWAAEFLAFVSGDADAPPVTVSPDPVAGFLSVLLPSVRAKESQQVLQLGHAQTMIVSALAGTRRGGTGKGSP